MLKEDGNRMEGEVRRLLDEIHDPCSVAAGLHLGLVEMGLVKSVRVSTDGDVDITLRLTSPFCEMVGFMKGEAIDRIAELPDVKSVNVQADSGFDWSPETMSADARRRRDERLLRLARSRTARGAGTSRRLSA